MEKNIKRKKEESKFSSKFRDTFNKIFVPKEPKWSRNIYADSGFPDFTVSLKNSYSYFFEMKAISQKKIDGFFTEDFLSINPKIKPLNSKGLGNRSWTQTFHIINYKNCFYVNYDYEEGLYYLVTKGKKKSFNSCKKLVEYFLLMVEGIS
jgi:hypothetical protein